MRNRADLVLFVCDGDLTELELAALRSLAAEQRPLFLVLNKADRYTRAERDQIQRRQVVQGEAIGHSESVGNRDAHIGHAELRAAGADDGLAARLAVPGYEATVERAVIVRVAGFDWNCPQHITPRFTLAEVERATQPLRDRIAELEARLA